MASMLYPRLLCLVIISLLSSPFLSFGKVAVVVENVQFANARPDGDDDNWLEIEIELEAPNGSGAMRPSVVLLGLELAVEVPSSRDFIFMRSELSFFLPEEGEGRTVYFYLPPALVDAWDLRREPYGWRVTMEHGGNTLPLLPDAYSQNLRERDAAQSFARRVQSDASEYDGWLQPIYLTPFFDYENGRFEECPSFLRFEGPSR